MHTSTHIPLQISPHRRGFMQATAMDTRFHCVYLLTSLDPQCKGDYYIGYTMNPLRRLRQHNGELVNGARRTKRRGRPWTLVCCVSGFTEDHTALKFEWCWQHPQESARLKHTLPAFLHGLHKLPYAIGVLHLLLRARLFVRLELTLHVIEAGMFQEMAAIALAHRPAVLRRPVTDRRDVRSPSSFPADNDTVRLEQGGEVEMLPPLVPNALLHIEEITLDMFQAKYLSEESVLMSFRSGNTTPTNFVTDTSSLMSCPYDFSVLSQAVKEEWEAERTSSSVKAVTAWEPHTGALSEDDDSTRRGGSSPPPFSCQSSQDPDRSLDTMASCASRSCPRVDGVSGSGAPLRSPSNRAPSPFLFSPPSSVAVCVSRSISMQDRSRAQREKPPPRIPLRFKYYTETDFAQEYQQELELLGRGLLACTFCALPLRAPYIMRCPRAPFCSLRAHIVCLAIWMQQDMFVLSGIAVCEEVTSSQPETAPLNLGSLLVEGYHCPFSVKASPSSGGKFTLVPTRPYPCPLCAEMLHWGSLVKNLKQRAIADQRMHSHYRRAAVEKRLQARLERAHLISQKRRQAAASAIGEAGKIPGKRGYQRGVRRSFSACSSRGASDSPPSLTFQARRRVQDCSSPTNQDSHFLRGTQVQQQQSQTFSDASEKWMTEERTLRVIDFDEKEWLNY